MDDEGDLRFGDWRSQARSGRRTRTSVREASATVRSSGGVRIISLEAKDRFCAVAELVES